MSIAEASSSLMSRLKQETAELHTMAESGDFQKHFVAGTLPKDRYIAMLEQSLLFHRPLEASLLNLRDRHPELGEVIRDEFIQEPYLLEDLEYFGVDFESISPLPSTREMIDAFARAEAAEPMSLLGHLYVLEGSNNGNRFIAKAVRAAYDLEGSDGTRYLDPYGEKQRELWMGFRTAMDRLTFTDAQRQAIVDAAKDCFVRISAVHRELGA